MKKLLIISVTNPIDKNKIYDNPHFKTTKKDKRKHGFGLLSVKNIVDKCSGTFEIKITDGFFVANVVI
jgi:sensor histidine kinase YesM